MNVIRILFISVLLMSNQKLSAQFVTIPDAGFASWLTDNYPTCMSGNQMDTTCGAITGDPSVYINDWGNVYNIQSLEGLQYFDSVWELLISLAPTINYIPALQEGIGVYSIAETSITSIPNFPNSLEAIYVGGNLSLTSVPPLPANLIQYKRPDTPILPPDTILPNTLEVYMARNSGMSELPPLPNGIRDLRVDENNFQSLPTSWPDSLEFLQISNCGLTQLPPNPPLLEALYCTDNLLTSIPALPPDFMGIDCTNNQLTYLPALPNGMTQLKAENNYFSCLPILPQTLLSYPLSLNLDGNPLNCIPNEFPSLPSYAWLQSLPLCTANDGFGCPSIIGIKGKVQQDLTPDCVNQILEPNIENVMVYLFDDNQTLLHTTTTNVDGEYYFAFLDSGQYTVVIDTSNVPYVVNCVSPGVDTLVYLAFSDTIVDSLDFVVDCKPCFDLGTQSVVSSGNLAPGQSIQIQSITGDLSDLYSLQCSSAIGDVVIIVDGPVTYAGSISGSLIPQVSGFTYTYTNVDFELIDALTDFGLNFNLLPSAQAGDKICVQVDVQPTAGDCDTSNNLFNTCFDIVNSYDPNMKMVYPDTVSPGFDDWLLYTIHFQNTGNGVAYNVRLGDTLPAEVDPTTIQPLSASHDYYVDIKDDLLTIHFNNIMLADSASNEPDSKGYFQFRAKPATPMVLGTEIMNKAGIYFDYNSPVITDYAISICHDSTSSYQGYELLDLIIYPNPSNGLFKVIRNGSEHLFIEIYNVDGSLVQRNESDHQFFELDLNSCNSGIYLVHFRSEQTSVLRRIILH